MTIEIDESKLDPAAYEGIKAKIGDGSISANDMLALFQYSQAVSLNRIATVLEGLSIEGLLDKIANHPMNSYGESFSDAIQNAHARGLNGITTY